MNAEQYRALVNKLEGIQQLNELAYGQEDPKNPGFMWVPADGTTPLGDGNTPTQMIQSGFGEYWNAKKVPFKKPEVAPTAPEVAPTAPEVAPTAPEVAPTAPEVTPTVSPDDKKPCDPDTLAKIKYMPSFNKAFAAARAAGCEKFDWCGVYTTEVGQGPMLMPEIPAAVGNPTVYAQGINMAVNRAKRIGIIGQSGPYTQQDVAKVVKGLQDGTIGHQLDPKSHSTSEVETFTRMLSDQLLKGDKRASADFKTPLNQRSFPAPTK